MPNYEQVNFSPESPMAIDNSVLLEAEKLMDSLEQGVKEYKNIDQSREDSRPLTQEILTKNGYLVKNELGKTVDDLANQLLTSADETEIRRAARIIARVSAVNYFGISSVANNKISDLLHKIDLPRWGLETNQAVDHALDDTDRVNLLFEELFKLYQIDQKQAARGWRESIFCDLDNKYEKKHGLKSDQQIELIDRNIRAMSYLESNRPGLAASLAKNFGIVNFGRYPVQSLTNQYDNIDNQDQPYGLIMVAQDDYSGALYNHINFLFDLPNHLPKNYLLRFQEVGGRFDVVRNLARLDQRYGDKHKISFAIFQSHGNTESLSLGDYSGERRSAYIDRTDLPESDWLVKVRNYFVPEATIISDSCLTGQKGGFAEELANKTKIKVLACDRLSGGISSIKAVEKEDYLDFKVDFYADRGPLLSKIIKSMPPRPSVEYKP